VRVNAPSHERCEACGFDGSVYDDASLVAALRAIGPAWGTLLADAGPARRVRPEPGVWSAVEYAAHSRDITALHCFGVEQALAGGEPVYPAIDGDSLIDTAAAQYGEEDAGAVVAALDAGCRRLAQLGADAPPDAWARGITIGEHRMTIRQLLEHALHDSSHHLDDVARGLRHIRDTT
jgi:hypothetical protein